MVEEAQNIEATEGAEESRLYEVSFHIVPTLDEAGAAQVAGDIRSLIEKNGGKVVGGEAPILMKLAYTIDKDIERKRHSFESAHFGWVIFESSPEGAHAVKEALAVNDSIVRALFIKTDAGATEFHKHPAHSAAPHHEPAPEEILPVAEKVEGQPMTVEAMDAEIAKLVVE